ncbi:hypothetical protein IE53DRAFT_390179 [Violaceomyces palustris]|uniref:Uncharacterized protein n=1 Tax=Violaceomyces palustris TaxID=1673888 RepID=A0ACD0NPF2_9BASI|nr:hypothetical protein IE53DRAFT_390179 [Violaceomyces palustris]
MNDIESIHRNLSSLYPGRSSQISQLLHLIPNDPSLPSPPSILCHDPNTRSHTSHLVSNLLESLAGTEIQEGGDRQPNQNLSFLSVSPLTTPAVQVLFSHILHRLARSSDSATLSTPQSSSPAKTDGTIDTFLSKLRSHLVSSRKRLVIQVDDSDRIRDLWPEHVWTAFTRLGELLSCQGRITVIFISTLPWSNYRNTSGSTISHHPYLIKFGRLAREDVLATLALDFPSLWSSYQTSYLGAQCHVSTSHTHSKRLRLRSSDFSSKSHERSIRKLHSTFCGIFYDSIKSNVRDVEEMRIMSAAVWHGFIIPVQCGEVSPASIQPLLLSSVSLFKDALVRLQCREVGPAEWASEARLTSLESCKSRLQASKSRNGEESQRLEQEEEETVEDHDSETEWILDQEEWNVIEEERIKRRKLSSWRATSSLEPSLPLIPTFLVIASFLGSYNPARMDVRYYLRDSSLISSSNGSKSKSSGGRRWGIGKGRRNKRKGGNHVQVDEDGVTENLNRQELLGPKPFPIDRLLSIFQSLITESGPEIRDSNELTSLLRRRSTITTTSSNDHTAEWEKVCRSAGVYSQIANLLSRRMIVRTSSAEKLNTVNLRTNVSYRVASNLAKSVRFDLDLWLWDWGGAGAGI